MHFSTLTEYEKELILASNSPGCVRATTVTSMIQSDNGQSKKGCESRLFDISRTHSMNTAVEDLWERQFMGEAADALWDHIVTHYKPDDYDKIYAHYITIVQSSGMGKSQTVNELSKRVFTIPLCLRDTSLTGSCPDFHSFC